MIATGTTISITRRDLAKMFDQSILRPAKESSTSVIQATAHDAIKDSYRSLVVYPRRIPLVKGLLAGSGVLTAAVCDFPHATESTEVRKLMVKKGLERGADEIDIVTLHERLLEGVYEEFEQDIREVTQAMGGKILKLILEVDHLNEELIGEATRRIANVAREVKTARLIAKTKTGFADGKFPNIEAVKIIRKTLEETGQYARTLEELGNGLVAIKASGGIRTLDEILQLRKEGVHIIGIGNGKAVLEQINT